MFPKLLILILVSGVTAAALLVTRQQRIETAHEMAEVHEQILRHERTLWHLRSEIAHRCRPEAVREMMEGLDDEWNPVCDPVDVAPEEDPADLTDALSQAG